MVHDEFAATMAATMAAAVLCGVLIVYCLLRCVLPEELNRFLSSEPEPVSAEEDAG